MGDDIESAVGEYGDLRTTNPRLYCEDCESFVYVTSPDESNATHYFLECDCSIGTPDDNIATWQSVSELVS